MKVLSDVSVAREQRHYHACVRGDGLHCLPGPRPHLQHGVFYFHGDGHLQSSLGGVVHFPQLPSQPQLRH